MERDLDLIKKSYSNADKNIKKGRLKLKTPLTLSEKILLTHLDNIERQSWKRGKSQLVLRPDRVVMQDATAQMALLQFMQASKKQVSLPTTIHCDHLIRADSGVIKDIKKAINENKEVYDFLSSASKKYGIGFWSPGAGIIHQVFLENYAFPGGLAIGSDSHTPNSGGLGMLSIGVGGADAGEVMAGLPWEVLHPELIGVKITGKLSGWASAKDLILYLCGLLTTKGGTNKIIEFFGPGAETISATGKATITNMGAELGATTSIFPFDDKIADYLKATNRHKVAELAILNKANLVADPEVIANPEEYFDELVEINLSGLEPYIVGPHTPDLVRPVSKMKGDIIKEGFPSEIKAALIGSCTNSSYEDIKRSANIAKQGLKAGLKAKVPFLVTPGSSKIFETVKRDGLLEVFEEMGALVLANACGPCIGQWKRRDIKDMERNVILSSFNRNFPGRNDGNKETLSFISSPEIVTAIAFSGNLNFDPLNDSINLPNGSSFMFDPPFGEELPARGFTTGNQGYVAPLQEAGQAEVIISTDSERIELLEPFPSWDGKDFIRLPILIKTMGKCTTDHISPAGKWLMYRGHLGKISENIFLGALNSFTNKTGSVFNIYTSQADLPPASAARYYHENCKGSIVVGDANYGEGSSREHAAMSPRYLGIKAIITRSFARIHETNLKKQGVLPLTFANIMDYDKFEQYDSVSVRGLASIAPGKKVDITIHKSSGDDIKIKATHTFTAEQIAWFVKGSALNSIQ